MKVKSEREVAQLCPTPSDPMDCSPPGFSAPGIFQARVLEWGVITFSKGGRGNTKTSLNPSTHFEVADPEKAFRVYIHEKEGIALRVLTQRLGPEPQSVTHLLKRLNPTS